MIIGSLKLDNGLEHFRIILRTYSLAVFFLTVICALDSCTRDFDPTERCDLASWRFVGEGREMDSKFLITCDSAVVISAVDTMGYRLLKLKDDVFSMVGSSSEDMFNPLLISGTLEGLEDVNGNEQFKLSNSLLNSEINCHSIEAIFSFNKVGVILYKCQGSSELQLLDVPTRTKKVLVSNSFNFHAASYSEATKTLVLSYDEELMCYDLERSRLWKIKGLPGGEKLNPSVVNDELYFVNNEGSEFYRIYRCRIGGSSTQVEVIYETGHDLRLPKSNGAALYFLELVNSEYLLKRINDQGEVCYITSSGVVYNYEFFFDEEMLISYSDASTPLSILRYDLNDNSISNLTSKVVNTGISIRTIPMDNEGSVAYELIPPHGERTKGSILFFHPGLHGDFSPRWDPILMNMCVNGYRILAPNYPMSIGYGKRFYNSGFGDALESLSRCKNYLLQYGQPLHYLSSSSGNLLMEELLTSDVKGVSSAASLFGTYRIEGQKIPIPVMYFLGENDPIVNFQDRKNDLLRVGRYVVWKSYSDEGHWFRKPMNREDAVRSLLSFFCANP